VSRPGAVRRFRVRWGTLFGLLSVHLGLTALAWWYFDSDLWMLFAMQAAVSPVWARRPPSPPAEARGDRVSGGHGVAVGIGDVGRPGPHRDR
jgi:hypothetical protein